MTTRTHLSVIQNPNCWGVGYTNVVTGKFHVRRVVWGRLLARAEKRDGETIKRLCLMHTVLRRRRTEGTHEYRLVPRVA